MSETQTDAPEIDATPAPEVDPSDDLRAALSAAYDEVAAEPDAEPEAPETSAADRDERGRFVARDGAEPEAEPEAPEVETQAAAPEPVAVPPELASVKGVLDEHRELYEARGIPPADAVRALFNAQRALQERPYEAIQQLARDFGVDLTQFGRQQAPQTNDQVLQAALARLEQLERAHTTQQQQAEQAKQAEIQQTISQFAADPKHVHFPAVQKMMGALMTSGQADDLATAYDMACRAHPTVFEAIQKAEKEAADKSAAAARSQAAAKAKAASVSVRGTPSVNGFNKPPETLRGALEAAWDGRLN